MTELVGPLKAKGHCSRCILCRYDWFTNSSHCTYNKHTIEKADIDESVTDYSCPFLYKKSNKQLQVRIRYFIHKVEGVDDYVKPSLTRRNPNKRIHIRREHTPHKEQDSRR